MEYSPVVSHPLYDSPFSVVRQIHPLPYKQFIIEGSDSRTAFLKGHVFFHLGARNLRFRPILKK